MKVFATWDIPDQLRNALLRHLHDFNAAHPGCRFEAFVQSTPTVAVAKMLGEPAVSVAQVLEREPAPDGPPTASASRFERALAAIRADPERTDRAIAKAIGVSHQTVMRARISLKKPSARKTVQGRNLGPRGPRTGKFPRTPERAP